MTRQNPIFPPHSVSIPLPSLFLPFFRQRCCFSGHRKRNHGAQESRIVSNRERPDLTALPVNSYISEYCRKNNQKFLFPAKSTWMPLGTKIFYEIFVTYYGLVDYKGVVWAVLFPVVHESQNYPLVRKLYPTARMTTLQPRWHYPLVPLSAGPKLGPTARMTARQPRITKKDSLDGPSCCSGWGNRTPIARLRILSTNRYTNPPV